MANTRNTIRPPMILPSLPSRALAESLFCLLRVVDVLEHNRRYMNLNPKCEPQLGKRGLYREMGGTSNSGLAEAMLWVLNFSDGAHSLLDIAERSRSDFHLLHGAANLLVTHNLLAQQETCV
jgi:aminopeptidase-like protein